MTKALYYIVSPLIYVFLLCMLGIMLFQTHSFIFNILHFLVYVRIYYLFLKWVSFRVTYNYEIGYYFRGMLICSTFIVLLQITRYIINNDDLIEEYILILAVAYTLPSAIFWWCVDVFGYLGRREYRRRQKMHERLQYIEQNRESIEKTLRENKWQAILYWYNKPIEVLKSVTGWPTTIKAPTWMIIIVWLEITFVLAAFFYGLRVQTNDLEHIYEFPEVFGITSIGFGTPTLLSLIIIFYLARLIWKPERRLKINKADQSKGEDTHG